jgi:hypothetical protein
MKYTGKVPQGTIVNGKECLAQNTSRGPLEMPPSLPLDRGFEIMFVDLNVFFVVFYCGGKSSPFFPLPAQPSLCKLRESTAVYHLLRDVNVSVSDQNRVD